MGIFEILLFLVIALIVIPPDDLPQVMRAAGKVMRELRMASNTVMREISSAIGEESPFNLLPPSFDDPHPPSPPATSGPPARAFLDPAADSRAAVVPPQSGPEGAGAKRNGRATGPLDSPASEDPSAPAGVAAAPVAKP